MNFKKWVKSIQTACYHGARTVLHMFDDSKQFSTVEFHHVENSMLVWTLPAIFLKISLSVGVFKFPC